MCLLGIGSRPGRPPPETIHEFVLVLHPECPFRIDSPVEGSRILLFEHDFHEGFPEDHHALLQDRHHHGTSDTHVVQAGLQRQGQDDVCRSDEEFCRMVAER